jgi:ABC-type polysaccharide/polyol phosphate export permease
MLQQGLQERGWRSLALRDTLGQLYHYRALIQVLVERELKARYRGAALGFLWSFMNPLLLMGIYTLVFSVYMRIDMESYPAFLLCGLLPWNCFAAGLNEATYSIIGNGNLIKKVYLPSEVFPLVYISSNVVHYLFSIPLLFFLLLLYHVPLSSALVLFPVILAIQFVLTYGLALILASLAVQFRDLLQVIPNMLMIWFFLTPVFYSRTTVPGNFRLLMDCNPMAHLIQAYQDIFFLRQWPPLLGLAVVALLACALFVVGLWCFEMRKDFFVEEL